MAPEFAENYVGPRTSAVDIWALGVILHTLLFNSLPYIRNYENYKTPFENPYEIPLPLQKAIDPSFIRILARCFDRDPNTRVKIVELGN